MASWGATPKKNEGPGLTPETQKLLDSIIAQRGLSRRAADDVKSSISSGSSNWVDHLNTGVAAFQAPKSQTHGPKVPKVGTGATGAGRPPPLPGRFSGIKLKHEIDRDNPAQRDVFIGGAPAPDRDAEKDRLSKAMELGGAKALKQHEAALQRQREAAAAAAAKAARVDPREALIDQIIDEVKERREFLETMRAAGRGDEYEAQIKGEIAVRLKELEKLGVR